MRPIPPDGTLMMPRVWLGLTWLVRDGVSCAAPQEQIEEGRLKILILRWPRGDPQSKLLLSPYISAAWVSVWISGRAGKCKTTRRKNKLVT